MNNLNIYEFFTKENLKNGIKINDLVPDIRNKFNCFVSFINRFISNEYCITVYSYKEKQDDIFSILHFNEGKLFIKYGYKKFIDFEEYKNLIFKKLDNFDYNYSKIGNTNINTICNLEPKLNCTIKDFLLYYFDMDITNGNNRNRTYTIYDYNKPILFDYNYRFQFLLEHNALLNFITICKHYSEFINITYRLFSDKTTIEFIPSYTPTLIIYDNFNNVTDLREKPTAQITFNDIINFINQKCELKLKKINAICNAYNRTVII